MEKLPMRWDPGERQRESFLNRLAHSYVVGARSGAAVIGAAVVAFMLLVSMRGLDELPVSGLVLGRGDDGSATPQHVAPARVAARPATSRSATAPAGGVAQQRRALAPVPSAATAPRQSHRSATAGHQRQSISVGDVAGRTSTGRANGDTVKQHGAPPSSEAATPPSTAATSPAADPAPAASPTGDASGRGSGGGAVVTPIPRVPSEEPEGEPAPPAAEDPVTEPEAPVSVPELVQEAVHGASDHSHGTVAEIVRELLAQQQ
jgi:hypothetical protein